MPAGWVALTAMYGDHGPTTPTDAAQCNDGHPFVELYRGYSTSEAKQFAAKHNASVHKISKFTAEPIHESGCIDWCNHCTRCGTGILYGSLCVDHQRVQEPIHSEPDEESK